jgi:Ribonucleases P/MRP protein subunit POP1
MAKHSSSHTHDDSRKRPRYTAQPAFCDATATVSATQFGARRLPEIKALWNVVQQRSQLDQDTTTGRSRSNSPSNLWAQRGNLAVAALKSGGRKTSARHLRRRATSHKCRRRSRRRHTPLPLEQDTVGTETVGDGQQEINTLQLCRRARRLTTSRLRCGHEAWREGPNNTPPATEQALASEAKVHWMSTHVWHAKRFRMESFWGWKVPLIHSNRGCAAALRLVLRESKCLVQDATWCSQPIWFQISGATTASKHAMSLFQEKMGRVMPGFAAASINQEPGTCAAGSGTLHHVDCFPRKAVGPVDWIWSRSRPLVPNDAVMKDTVTNDYFAYFFVHPAVSQSALSIFAAAFQDSESNADVGGPFHGVSGGLACLRLRGSSSATCLLTGIRNGENPTNTTQQANLADFRSLLERASHGTCVWTPRAAVIAEEQLFIRCIRPRDPSQTLTNWVACGLDVFCAPTQAKRLFLELILGGACPIGISEEAFLTTECDPPLPVFPRDFPDTAEGLAYWCNSSFEWHCVRSHWEGGEGRISIPNDELTCPPAVRDVLLASVSYDDIFGGAGVVVVRGTFGDPFIAALSGCAIPPLASAGTCQRRKRRSTGSGALYVEARRISAKDFASHQEMCESLLQALSLPAVLLCHVQAAEKGSLVAGSALFPMGDDDGILGYMSSGAFSQSRGRYHGIAVVRAALFLKALADSRSRRSCVVVQRLGGTKELHLLIRFKVRPATFRRATLSLLYYNS